MKKILLLSALLTTSVVVVSQVKAECGDCVTNNCCSSCSCNCNPAGNFFRGIGAVATLGWYNPSCGCCSSCDRAC